MEKIRLNKLEVSDNEMDLIAKFIVTAKKQGFELEWVDRVINKIEKSQYDNITAILLEHVEIIK